MLEENIKKVEPSMITATYRNLVTHFCLWPHYLLISRFKSISVLFQVVSVMAKNIMINFICCNVEIVIIN